MSTDCRKLDPGHIRFYDDYVPTLGIGTYLINLAQQIEPPQGAPKECHVASQAFSVTGPRYSLPESDVFSVFPPSEALGNFDSYLPHVVLAKEDLPWERNVFDESPQAPWMAVLLFAADELVDGKPALLMPDDAPANRTMTRTISIKRFDKPAKDEVAWPDFTPEWHEKELLGVQCNVIDVSVAAFRAFVPTPAELRYLVHVRQVDPSAKESQVLKISRRGWYSVLVSKRLPERRPQATRYIAHLVSLEGMKDYLAGRNLENKTRVRMIALKSWTFTCAPALKEDFTHLMNGLLTEQKASGAPIGYRLPLQKAADNSPDSQYAGQAIQNGYVPTRYQTRQGEETIGWYRGPFSPQPASKFVVPDQGSPSDWLFFDRASSAMIYDKEFGVFDLSYAAAWEAGRLAALANGPFGQALLEWQRRGTRRLAMAAERLHQIPLLALSSVGGNSPASAGDSLMSMSASQWAEVLAPQAITHGLVETLVDEFDELLGLGDEPPAHIKNDGLTQRSFFDSPSPSSPRQAMEKLLAHAPVREMLISSGEKGLEPVVDFLADLYLLMHIPARYLIPHFALLPPESVRFFHVDANWLDAAMEGALSIGVESSKQQAYQNVMKESILAAVRKATRQKRQTIAGTGEGLLRTDNADTVDPKRMTGMLLRSALVSGWRGLEVHAYARIKPTDIDPARPDIESWIQPLRIDRLSDNVLLAIWGDVPAVVTIDEPSEGVAFGFEDAPADAATAGRYIYLRRLTEQGYGMLFPPQERKYIDATARALISPASQLDVAKLREEIKIGARASQLNVRDFALEMVRVPQQGVFAWKDRPQRDGDRDA